MEEKTNINDQFKFADEEGVATGLALFNGLSPVDLCKTMIDDLSGGYKQLIEKHDKVMEEKARLEVEVARMRERLDTVRRALGE